MTNKLSLSQIDDALKMGVSFDYLADDFEDLEDVGDIDETVYRTSYQRKELRSNRQREEGEMVGKGCIRKHRKY